MNEKGVREAVNSRREKRDTGFEPATSTLARSHSTTELVPRRDGQLYILKASRRRRNWAAEPGCTVTARMSKRHWASWRRCFEMYDCAARIMRSCFLEPT